MPAGYEKIRDAFIAKGMDEDEAKKRAAKIWNKHHKGDEAVGRHYDEKMKTEMSFFNMAESEGGCTLLGIPQEHRVELGLVNPRRLMEKTGRGFLYQHDLKAAAKGLGRDIEHVASEGEHELFKVADTNFKIHKRETPEKLAEMYKQAGGRGRGGMPMLGGLEAKTESLIEFAAASPSAIRAMGDDITAMVKILKKRASKKVPGVPQPKLVGDIQHMAAQLDEICLGIPISNSGYFGKGSLETYNKAEKLLQARLKELGKSAPSDSLKDLFKNQERKPLAGPIPTHRPNFPA
jgi:hypothetical protein